MYGLQGFFFWKLYWLYGFFQKLYGFLKKCTDFIKKCTDFFRKLYGLYEFFRKLYGFLLKMYGFLYGFFSKKVWATLVIRNISWIYKHYDFFQEVAKFTKIILIFETILELNGFQSPFHTILGRWFHGTWITVKFGTLDSGNE